MYSKLKCSEAVICSAIYKENNERDTNDRCCYQDDSPSSSLVSSIDPNTLTLSTRLLRSDDIWYLFRKQKTKTNSNSKQNKTINHDLLLCPYFVISILECIKMSTNMPSFSCRTNLT